MASTIKSALEHFNTGAAKYEASLGGSTRELARYLIDISPPINSDSRVLDSACGTGIMAQEILFKQYAEGRAPPKLSCVDGAVAMVDLARATCSTVVDETKAGMRSGPVDITFDSMMGEELHFPENHFTHSYTNQGILFFKDAKKGAQEIYRTLKPGGTAVVTSWKELGYVPIIQAAQKVVTPDAPPFRIPISQQWFQASHLEETLRDAGFADLDVHEKEVHYAFKTLSELCDMMLVLLGHVMPGLSEQQKVDFKKQFEAEAVNVVVKTERLVSGNLEGQTEELFGLKMIALVGVAKK